MKFRNLLKAYHLFFMVFLIIEEASAANRRNAFASRGNKFKNDQNRRHDGRAVIIKCCGATSCTNFQPIGKSSTLAGNKTVTVVSQKLSTEEFARGASEATTAITDENSGSSSSEGNSIEPTVESLVAGTGGQESLSIETTSSETQSSSMTKIESTTAVVTTSSTSTPSTTTIKPQVFPNCEAPAGLDTSLFNADKTLKNVDSYGSWVESCGQQFLFGKKFVSWNENLVQCNKIGMEPLAFENNGKIQCFKNLTTGWRYNSIFWTSGLRTAAPQFSWCSKNGSLLVDSSKQLWDIGQPDFAQDQHCLHLNVDKANATYQISDQLCNNSYVFACQGPTTPAPACSSPICPNFTCTKNLSLFENSTTGDFLKAPDLHGSWFKNKGRVYMFSFAYKTYLGALQGCCEIGMSLLSLEFDYKYLSLQLAIQENVTQEDTFWTSGSDQGCESSFGYCSAKRLLRKEAIWALGQPDNAKGSENSLAVSINETRAQLADFNAERTFKYICETRDSSSPNTTGASAIQNECAAVYNVSEAEISTLLSKPQFDIRIKCFMKCLGENTGLIVDGKVIARDILAIVEKMANGSVDEMKKNFLIMDDCSNSAKGMDECDQAAQLIQCTNDKAPNIVNGVINNIVESIPAKNAGLFPTAVCPQVTCTVNATAKSEFDSTTTDATISTGWVRFSCNKKWLQQNGNLDLLGAYKSCCQIGLKLASIEAQAEIQCLHDSGYNSALTWVAGSSNSSPLNPRWCTAQSNGPIQKHWYVNATDPALPELSGFVMILSDQTIQAENPANPNWSLCV
ncbi:uncharacterized protein LOC132200338 [Neocloeon triangulifer]|uniref:uncharacterized protein LOC132200338 n=1 Tax=Neocloeon triangulifer TaxID=2078957 RepID=UPI00286EE9F2|nr:uncharacterized protein LOC132200338 [Neocloeon triangulifer]